MPTQTKSKPVPPTHQRNAEPATAQLGARVPETLASIVREAAKTRGQNRSDLLRDWVEFSAALFILTELPNIADAQLKKAGIDRATEEARLKAQVVSTFLVAFTEDADLGLIDRLLALRSEVAG